jgi:hypothetical protein
MSVETWDRSLRIFDNIDVHAGKYQEPAFVLLHAREVDEFHRASTAAGFRSNGAPGYRDCRPGC